MTTTSSIPAVPTAQVRSTIPAGAGTAGSTFEATFHEASQQVAAERGQEGARNVGKFAKADTAGRQQFSARPERNFKAASQMALTGSVTNSVSAIAKDGSEYQAQADPKDLESRPTDRSDEQVKSAQLDSVGRDQAQPNLLLPDPAGRLAEGLAMRPDNTVSGSDVASDAARRMSISMGQSIGGVRRMSADPVISDPAESQKGVATLDPLESGIISASFETHFVPRGMHTKFSMSLAPPAAAEGDLEDASTQSTTALRREPAALAQIPRSSSVEEIVEIAAASSQSVHQGEAAEGARLPVDVARQVAEAIAVSSNSWAQGDGIAAPDLLVKPEQQYGSGGSDPARSPFSANDEIVRSLRVRLHPDSLGQVDVHLSLRGDQLRVRLLVENATTAEAFKSQHADLAHALSGHGLRLAEVVVDRNNVPWSSEQQAAGGSQPAPDFDTSGMSGGGSHSQRRYRQPSANFALEGQDDTKSVASRSNDIGRLGKIFV
ncbi:MAG: flagellar hook-length control protein FliK [Proteobacteria bacterium]|nr:flagellar hook-length control protein FliK [Pseudomonadota bacterium]